MAETNEEQNKEIDLNDWTINSVTEKDVENNINKYANNYMEIIFRNGTIRVVLKEPPSLSIDVKWDKSPATAMADMIKQFTCNDTFEMGAILGGQIAGNNGGYKHLVESGVYSSKCYNGIEYPKFSVSFRAYTDSTIFGGTSSPKSVLQLLKSTMPLASNQVTMDSGINNIGAAYDNTKEGVTKLVKFVLNKNNNQGFSRQEKDSMGGFINSYLKRISINGYKVTTSTDVDGVPSFTIYVNHDDREVKVGELDNLEFTAEKELDNYPILKPLILDAIDQGKKDGYRNCHPTAMNIESTLSKVQENQEKLFSIDNLLKEEGSILLGGNVCKIKILPYGILGKTNFLLSIIDDWSVEKSRITNSGQSLYYDFNMSFSLCQIPNMFDFISTFNLKNVVTIDN